jgi:hypothetical protein
MYHVPPDHHEDHKRGSTLDCTLIIRTDTHRND